MRRLYFLVGLLSFLGVHGLFLAKIEPVATYFFVFVWWSYIILVDGFIYWQRESSLISQLKGKFLLLILASASFWLFFEILNLRIANWSYQGPHFSSSLGEIIFQFFAFGSVIPAILETNEFLHLVGIGPRLEFLQWEHSGKFLKWIEWGRPGYLWMVFGIGMIIVALLWPAYFFWLVWIAAILIFDPAVERDGGPSLFSELREGKVRNCYRLLATGLVCGVLWEAWNYWAGLKWVYRVPIFGEGKIFEMPVLGYLGFPVFAIECYVFYQWLGCQKTKVDKAAKKLKLNLRSS